MERVLARMHKLNCATNKRYAEKVKQQGSESGAKLFREIKSLDLASENLTSLLLFQSCVDCSVLTCLRFQISVISIS